LKILMFYAPSFWYSTFEKTLDQVPDMEENREVKDAIVVFYHAEASDVERSKAILTKFIKNIKWLSGKFRSRTIVIHSFNHLAVTKAPVAFTLDLIADAVKRLENSGFTVTETPFGYLNEWKIHVAGESLAKVFKEL